MIIIYRISFLLHLNPNRAKIFYKSYNTSVLKLRLYCNKKWTKEVLLRIIFIYKKKYFFWEFSNSQEDFRRS